MSEFEATQHSLKTCPEPFAALWSHTKSYETRKFDRDFKVGDIVRLFEYYPAPAERFTGRYIRAVIVHITPPGCWGLPSEVGVFGIDPLEMRSIEPIVAKSWCINGERWGPKACA